MIRPIAQLNELSEKLPLFPERLALYAGIVCVGTSMYNIEFGNPILGGIQAIVGGLTIGASVSTEAAHEALDNRGEL